MVELKLTGKCDGCNHFELHTGTLISMAGQYKTVAVCANQDLCDHLEQHLKEALKNG